MTNGFPASQNRLKCHAHSGSFLAEIVGSLTAQSELDTSRYIIYPRVILSLSC